MRSLNEVSIAVIGLGYVGLPLANLLSTRFPVTGFDHSEKRIDDLRHGIDRTGQTERAALEDCKVHFTSNEAALATCNFYIVAVPTPIDAAKQPDMSLILEASRTVGAHLGEGDIVVYESTVYPGATEEDCVPVLERASGLTLNSGFFAGYSPERVNPGDKTHTIDKIIKVTSGSTPQAADLIDQVYGAVITAGTYRAPSIKVAEAAKVIENTQRDINIALVNELAQIFERLGIDTMSVLKAAGTKWNFLPFRPGLVGGHCIGVDPYYLTHKAIRAGHNPEIILAGRRINDAMGAIVASRMIKAMAKRGLVHATTRIGVLGLTFKENCPDIRNTKVADVITELVGYGIAVDVHDPIADSAEALEEYGLSLTATLEAGAYDGVLLAVPHDFYRDMGPAGVRGLIRKGGVLFDLKAIFEPDDSEVRL